MISKKEGLNMNHTKLTELQSYLQANSISVAYLSNPTTIAYLSGFESDPHERILGLFISATTDPFLFTPALDAEPAKNSSWQYDVIGYLDSENPYEKIKKELLHRYPSLDSIGLEKGSLSLDRYEILTDLFPNVSFSANLTPVIETMQLKKTADEITRLLEAGHWADVAFEIGFSAVKAGVSEQEIVAEIEYQLKRRGVSQMSFDTLVLAGTNAANPHGTPGANQVKENELVLFDLGVVWKGYCSDATRTVSFGEPTSLQQEVYNVVLNAQLAVQKAVKPGVTAEYLDRVAREVISEAGYGEYFTHRLGHGLGMSVHEYPSLVAGNDLVIEDGMCFSLEPGIYIPGKVGVRIEDCVHVTSDGCEPFTKTSKKLLTLH